MKMKSIIIVFIIISMCSCLRTLPDEVFTMTLTPDNGNEIRLDGCYISEHVYNNRSEYNFFYSNGVMFVFSDLLTIENISQFTGGIDEMRKLKTCWGIFQVDKNTIKAQRWKPSDDAIQCIVQNRTYKIINDTTLSIDLLNDGDIRYYHFKHFSPKPDSTNVFIK